MRRLKPAFPVGLYSVLLGALAWLTFSGPLQPIERLLVGAAAAVPRVAAAALGEPVVAADRDALARIELLGDELRQRVLRHDFAGAAVFLPAGDQPRSCGVLSVSRRGGGGRPAELRLDRSHADLSGCRPIVTKGDTLLGFLVPPGQGAAANDQPGDPARVVLLHHPDARRVLAGLSTGTGAGLRFVVRAAGLLDPAPLRVDLWDDPGRAAQLDRGGEPVRALPSDCDPVPGGLLIGHTRIWGYEGRGGGAPLAIGVFVVPPFDARALSHVVVWQQGGTADVPEPASLRARHRVTAVVHDLPGAIHGRHLLVAGRPIPDGAAVVQDGLFLGTARALAFGVGLVTSFVATRQRWSLIVLPDDRNLPARELHAQVERSDGGVALLRILGDHEPLAAPAAGHLFSGSNGRYCPAGLWIGRVAPHRLDAGLVEVTTPVARGPRAAEVFVAAGGP